MELPRISKLECKGGFWGKSWDDGTFDGVRKVSVTYYDDLIKSIRFDYMYEGKVKKRHHGLKGAPEEQFEIDYPNEFITSVEVTYFKYNENLMHSLIFKTSKGRTCQFGKIPHGHFEQFVLENKGCALVGYGLSTSTDLIALGAYSSPLSLSPVAEKLGAQGVNLGHSWDDGYSFDGVRKICVGFCDIGIAFIKFVYNKGHHLVFGDDHGSNTVLSFKELEVGYPSEYLISIDGCYDKVAENKREVITMLKFKTNLKPFTVFGIDKASNFKIGKEGHKIVGFHGKSSKMLHQIGVYVLPIDE